MNTLPTGEAKRNVKRAFAGTVCGLVLIVAAAKLYNRAACAVDTFLEIPSESCTER